MLGSNLLLPFLAAMAGALFAIWIGGQNSLVWGAAVGFGVGCVIVALVWLLFAVLKKWAGDTDT
jgi:hypothetical protein